MTFKAILALVAGAIILAAALSFLLPLGTLGALGAEQRCGDASYYAHRHHGRTMANGEPFNMHAMTAAMWDVPFGTRFRVTYEGRSVVVTITDRGPARRLNRIIDLSRGAAAQLGMIEAGVGTVCLTRL
jgi:rare lipoprotein A